MPKTLDEAIDEVVADLPDNSDLEPAEPETEPEVEDLDEDLDDEVVDEPLDEDEDTLEDDDDVEEDDEDLPEGAIELSEDDEVVLPDGTVVSVKEAALRQSDYTRKTQELAEQRKQLEQEANQWQAEREELLGIQDEFAGWLETRMADPAGWAREVVADSPNPTQTIAQAIVELNKQGLLDPAFAEQFKLEAPESAVAAAAEGGVQSKRLEELERRQKEQDEAARQQAENRQIVAQMFQDWEQLKVEQGLSFDSEEDEHTARRETLKFAIENDLIGKLGIARAALDAQSSSSTKTKKTPRTNQVPDKKKRATRSMNRRSSGSSRAPAPKKAKSIEGAAELAVEDWLARS